MAELPTHQMIRCCIGTIWPVGNCAIWSFNQVHYTAHNSQLTFNTRLQSIRAHLGLRIHPYLVLLGTTPSATYCSLIFDRLSAVFAGSSIILLSSGVIRFS